MKIDVFLQANELPDLVEYDETSPLPKDPTLAQIRNQREERKMKYKAKTCIHLAVSKTIFTKIMAFDTIKHAWDLVKEY